MPALLSLPGEILSAIVHHLGPSQADFDNFDHGYSPDASLYRLAQTCTTLRDMTTLGRYEICNLKMHYPLDGLVMLRTLAARPELACRVKRVIVDGGFTSDRLYIRGNNREAAAPAGQVLLSAKEAARYNGILETNLNMEDVTLLSEIRSKESPDRNVDDAIGESLACVALALVPNVTSIVFSTYYKSLPSFKPGTFPRLEAFSLQHADTELAANLGYVEGVLRAAPALQRIIGWSIRELPQSASYASIRELVLGYSRMDEDEVGRLAQAFPKLERFVYDDGGACVSDHMAASPREFSEALLGLRTTLKSAQIVAWFTEDLFDFFDGDDAVMHSLAPMAVLEHLQVYAQHIFQTDYDDMSATRLVSFLPRSIQTLCIEGLKACHLQDILAVARCAASQFPALVRVSFPELEEALRRTVEITYSEHGVQCSFEPIVVNTYSCSCD